MGLGFEIYFVTSRVHNEINSYNTWHLLKLMGFHTFQGLFLMPPEYMAGNNPSPFKFSLRQKFANEGSHVVLNIGNHWYDLMLLEPYRLDDEAQLHRNQLLHMNPNTFIIAKMPDVAWMSIKLPSEGCTPWWGNVDKPCKSEPLTGPQQPLR
jgi:hypothetical protein